MTNIGFEKCHAHQEFEKVGSLSDNYRGWCILLAKDARSSIVKINVWLSQDFLNLAAMSQYLYVDHSSWDPLSSGFVWCLPVNVSLWCDVHCTLYTVLVNLSHHHIASRMFVRDWTHLIQFGQHQYWNNIASRSVGHWSYHPSDPILFLYLYKICTIFVYICTTFVYICTFVSLHCVKNVLETEPIWSYSASPILLNKHPGMTP